MAIISNYIDHCQSGSREAEYYMAHAEGEARSTGRTPRGEDGQHYSNEFYNPGVESGQRAVIPQNYRVGQLSGAEQRSMVGIVHPGTDSKR